MTFAFKPFAVAMMSLGLHAALLAQTNELPPTAQAAQPDAFSALRQAAQLAININPEVTARLNAARASNSEVDVARGGFYPRVDLNGEAGRTHSSFDPKRPDLQSYSRSGLGLSVNQLLWDGRSTALEVERLDHARQARYFEFVDTAEQSALEAARAFYDVQRFRSLVSLAEENYIQHKYTYNLLTSRVKAGVGRGVDLEQTNARLALAESNLTIEIANLHDVMARYQRVVGNLPDTVEGNARLPNNLPSPVSAAARKALDQNARISAAVENLRAVRAQLEQRRAQQWQPVVEARLRGAAGHNLDGNVTQRRDASALLVLNWNLFNGGSDAARVSTQAALLAQAADLRDQACRDVRQASTIAYNDITKLTSQLAKLDRNVVSIQKARDAYRQQFDIGQRNLLDLLNSENELYTAKRSYANAQAELDIAYARAHASANTLIAALGLQRPDLPSNDATDWSAGEDGPDRCPIQMLEVPVFDRTALDTLAAQMMVSGPRTAPAALVAEPAAKSAAAAPAASVAPSASAQAEQRLREWAAAWEAKDADRYLSFYSPAFSASKPRAQWEAGRRAVLGLPGRINIALQGVKIRVIDDNHVETSFAQVYTSATVNDSINKTVVWQREGQTWKILYESNR